MERPQWMIDGFRSTVLDCDLIDIHMEGYQFTWFRSRGLDSLIEERLDRVMATPAWRNFFPKARLSNEIASILDHSPILLSTENTSSFKSSKRFKFENH